MIYLSSDYHFFHKNIITYSKRPFASVPEMNEALIANHNSVITPEDDFYFLGDFAFCSIEWQKEILSKLNGRRKVLIWGNHDRKETQMRYLGFDEFHINLDMEYSGIKFRLSHFPFAPTDPKIAAQIKCAGKRPSREGCDFLLCGHVHERWKRLDNMINVGCDNWDFKPISLDQIVEETKKEYLAPDVTIYSY